MERKIRAIALVVKDYDEAIQFYTEKLNYKLIEDTRLDDKKRWVLIAPNNQTLTKRHCPNGAYFELK